jgi:fumarate reductase flavoprotein subunit
LLGSATFLDVGILRDASGLSRARDRLVELDEQLDRTGVDGSDLRFNLTWHDWLNLKSLVLVSRAITEAAAARENSCGAHFREDHPERGPPEQSAYTRISLEEGRFRVTTAPVAFTRVRPGRTLLTV